MLELKRGANDKVIPFLMVSSTDHIAGKTGIACGSIHYGSMFSGAKHIDGVAGSGDVVVG